MRGEDIRVYTLPQSAINRYCRLKYLLSKHYLRTFLNDPRVPPDNDLDEQAIRPFCVGKKNRKLIDTVSGTQASAILYSIVETAKANDLNICQYLEFLLTEIPKHMDDMNLDFRIRCCHGPKNSQKNAGRKEPSQSNRNAVKS